MNTATVTKPGLAPIQREALQMMHERNIGSIYIPGAPNWGWVFPFRIREDVDIAAKVVEALSKKGPANPS